MRKFFITIVTVSAGLALNAQIDPKQEVKQDTTKRAQVPADAPKVDVLKEEKSAEPTQKGEKKTKSKNEVKKETPKN